MPFMGYFMSPIYHRPCHVLFSCWPMTFYPKPRVKSPFISLFSTQATTFRSRAAAFTYEK